MYYPVGWPRVLDGRGATGGTPLQLLRHRTKNLIFELRGHSLAVWHSRLHVLLTSYKLSPANIKKHGINSSFVIKPDGTCIAVSTTNGLLYFLHVTYNSYPNHSKWRYSYREHGIYRHTPGLELPSEGPPLEQVCLHLIHEVTVPGHTYSLCSIAGQIMIATDQGVIQRINWDSTFDMKRDIHLNKLPFSNDNCHETRAHFIEEFEYVIDISYCPELHGFVIVLSCGKTAFVTGKSAKFEPQSLHGVWLRDTTDGIRAAVNPRYNMITCGRTNGLIDTYIIDESTGAWNKINTLQLSRLHFADSDQYQLGSVQSLQWSPYDYSILAVAWKNGGLSMWSVFGSLLFHSLGNQPGTPTPLFRSQSTLLQSLMWSIDGYQLWLLPRGEQLLDHTCYHDNRDDDCTDNDSKVLVAGSHVVVINFVKSAFINNPILSNHEYLVLHSTDRLYIGPLSYPGKMNGNGYYGNNIYELNKTEGASQWKMIQLPPSYLATNWPIQFVAINSTGELIVTAGKSGLAIYFIHKRKWKLFGSELQEQSIVCKGGLAWYKDIIIFPCRVNDKKDEIHFYSVYQNLDTSRTLCNIHLLSLPVKINVLGPHLLIASKDSTLTLYTMILTTLDNITTLSVIKLHVMSFLPSLTRPWALTLVSIVPSSIRAEPSAVSSDKLESILLNISGRVLMVQRESIHSLTEAEQEWSFSNPVSIAPFVEAIWTPPSNSSHSNHHLMESLWLACGGQGIKVWLPLYPHDEVHPTFLSKRIMLTLPLSSSFPQTILFSESIIIGMSHEPLHADQSLTTPLYFPPTTVRRITRLFLNHILRQLLKRNLGNHALYIARRHAHLSYFAHILELMLHEILEEEAPGSVPIPDALLPRVIEFIKQFPHFFETVGSCARKTEVALWHYLFAAVGNPKDLFEICLSDSKLKTAATYLIIIQNLEPPAISRHLATRLLDAALDDNQWELCKDLVRFLKRIGPGDGSPNSPISSLPTPLTPSIKTPKSTAPESLPTVLSSPSGTFPDLDQSIVAVTRDHLSSGSVSTVVSVSGDYCDTTGKVIKRPHFALDVDTKEDFFIELILSRHARKLLSSGSLIDLGLFAAHLDFDLHQWMSKERHRAACIDNYIQVLCDLHKQFHWPFPSPSALTTPSSAGNSTKDRITVMTIDSLNKEFERSEEYTDSTTSNLSKSGIKRTNRPPDLNIPVTPSTTEVVEPSIDSTLIEQKINEEVVVQSSTPSKLSAAGSYDNSLKRASSSEHICDSESLVETFGDSSLWEDDVAMSMAWTSSSRTVQSEQEIRYFVDASIKSLCLEWVVILGILLQDPTIFIHISQQLTEIDSTVTFPLGIEKRIFDGVASLNEWASIHCHGYIPFLSVITPILYQWQQPLIDHSMLTSEKLNDPSAHQLLQNQIETTDSASDNKLVSQIKLVQDLSQESDDNSSGGCVIA